MTAPRKICVVTGGRAEYGLLYWLMKEIQVDPALELQIAVTGMHLSPEFGMTVTEIEKDGLPIAARVEMLLSSDSPVGITKSMGLGLIGFADAFARLQPDLILVLGDRFEILAAAQAALFARIPLAHIHGGELTEGAADESIRHALTKLAHLHFVAADPYRRRVIQLGEQPERVFLTGAPGLDHVVKTPRLSRSALAAELGMELNKGPLFLVTYHPATLGDTPPEAAFAELLAALNAFPESRIIFTRPNADTHGRGLNDCIDHYVEAHPERTKAFTSLGQLRYLSAVETADAMIGNSSSGLTEGPLLKCPTVNIGNRQGGRLRAPSVLDCGESRADIEACIRRAMSAEHRAITDQGVSVYGHGDASRRIVDILRTVSLDGLTVKPFHDLPAGDTP